MDESSERGRAQPQGRSHGKEVGRSYLVTWSMIQGRTSDLTESEWRCCCPGVPEQYPDLVLWM